MSKSKIYYQKKYIKKFELVKRRKTVSIFLEPKPMVTMENAYFIE